MRSSATNSPESSPPPESRINGSSPFPAGHLGEAGRFLNEACLSDMDNFVKMLGEVIARGARPDLVGSVISHCATRWLPELAGCEADGVGGGGAEAGKAAVGSMAAWMKKRFFVETLVGLLPQEKDALPCGFLLRLLRVANMVGAEPAQRAELETRVATQLEQASLRELMIPAFSHTCATLLDVGLTLRLVLGFAGMDKSGAATVKVAKLVDGYLAEAAVDANLTMPEFVALAGALPGHARSTDDGLYRAVDTYLKAHPSTRKEERKALCRLIDVRKLSSEASLHASQNERLPLRAVVQVLFSEHIMAKLNRLSDWSGSFSGPRSPNAGAALELPARCPSKREVMAQQQEIRRLRDDVARLQVQCHSLQAQIDRLVDRKRRGGAFFNKWRSLFFKQIDVQVEEIKMDEQSQLAAASAAVSRQLSVQGKKPRAAQGKTPNKRRNSLS